MGVFTDLTIQVAIGDHELVFQELVVLVKRFLIHVVARCYKLQVFVSGHDFIGDRFARDIAQFHLGIERILFDVMSG